MLNLISALMIAAGKVLTNKNKDLFLIRLGVSLSLAKWGIVGVGATILTPFFCGFLGLLVETAVFKIDLSLDALKEGIKLKDFEKEAKELYEKTVSKVHTEEEKERIRKQYLEVISLIGTVGNGPK